jgi:two-component system, sensor histidine kinase and response regulator
LDLTSIESGQRKRALASVDLSEIVRQAMENVKAEAERRSISIQLDVPDGSLMDADRTEIEMIINNLISNAVKYNRDHGQVGLVVSMAGDEVRIQVQDTGVGMTQEEMQRLFSDFSRIKNEKTRHILGSGLGLSTIKKLAMLYNGDITVKSKPDVGSTFTATLQKNFKAES